MVNSDKRDQFLWELSEELENISAQIVTLTFIAKPDATAGDGLKMSVNILESYIMGITDHISHLIAECQKRS